MFIINRLIQPRFFKLPPTNYLGCAKLLSSMSQAVPATDIIRKPRYDGRSKKRKWEDRRSDLGEGLDNKRDKTEPYERVKRRKFVLLLGYSGLNYYGMQRNPKMLTIEEELFTALLKSELITQEAYNQVQTIQFQRAARTDKGVSAARQVVSLKLPEVTEISKINDLLPESIRVFGIRRVTKGFNSKSQCDARTYFYMLPTVAFANFNEKVEQETYRLSDKSFEDINGLLGKFVGTKNFHNFTSKKRFNDPSASRYIMSFICEKPFVSNGIEFAVLKVRGQSFMMHQIRKMVGITLGIIRGHTNEETLVKSFTKERVNIPRAPGLGLVLDFVHYQRYNERYGSDHDKLEWKEEDEAVDAFKEKYIYPTIVDTEIKEKSMVNWLEFLLIHRYDVVEDDPVIDDEGSGDDDDDDGSSNGKKEVDDKINNIITESSQKVE